MSKSFNNLKKKLSPRAQKIVAKKTQKMLKAMPLQELRQARQLSQEHLAQVLSAKQASISRLERRADMYISTLRSYIEAMGGKLSIVAKFSDGDVNINQFEQIRVVSDKRKKLSHGVRT